MQVEENCCDFNLTKVVCANKEELPRQLKKALDKIAHNEGYTNYRILSRTISTEGGNYMASLYEVDIKGKTSDKERETNIFIKHVISQENIKIVDVSDLYSKELFFYTDLSRLFNDLEIEAGVPHDERYKSVKAYSESNTEAIILQNLAKDGYGTLYRMDVMPLKFAELSIQQLAKFHALNFVIERKHPQYFERKIKTLKQSIQNDDTFKEFCTRTYKNSIKGLDSDTKSKLDAKLPEFLDRYLMYLMGDNSVCHIKCLCHGDYRMNNVLIKTMEGEITDVMPVDYQLLYYGSPMIDFIYFIFGATDSEFRENHLDDLKEMYFRTMKNYLKYFEIDIDTVYPRKDFERDYFEYLDYGLYLGLFLMPFFFTLEEDVPDLNKDDVLNFDIKVDHRYQDRLKEIIDDMIHWGKL